MPTLPSLSRRSTAAVAVTGLLAAGLATLALAPAAQANPGAAQPDPVCNGTTCTVTYDYTGEWATFTVPDGITSVRAALTGAASMSNGGTTTATIATTPGAVFNLAVGQTGAAGGSATFGGGGAAGSGTGYLAGGGGSFLSSGGQLLLVAGGGGGGQYYIAGSGGGTTGGGGSTYSVLTDGGTNPTGGSQTAGGKGAAPSNHTGGTDGTGPATAASFGNGGTGGANTPNTYYGGGGGGGGGYYGGGGGGWDGGGAGGSGFVAPSLSITNASSVTPGVARKSANGSVSFTWDRLATTTTLTPNVTRAGTNNTVLLTATVSSDTGTPTGTVAFKDGSTAITGCEAQAVQSDGTATCSTKFAAGSHALAAAYSGATLYANSASAGLDYPVFGITTASLSDAGYDTPYSKTVAATGGTAPFGFALVGDHPAWLSINDSTGELTGTPDALTSSPQTVTVFANDANGTSSTKQFTISVGKGVQTLDFTIPADGNTVGGSSEITGVTKGHSGNDVVFTGNGNCTVSATTVTYTHPGTCTVTANQDGDDNYLAAKSVSHDAAVGKASQPIAITSTAPQEPKVDDTYTVTATGGASGKPVTFTGNAYCTTSALQPDHGVFSAKVTFTKATTSPDACTITASQDGTADYAAAAGQTQDVSVGKGTQTVTITSEAPDAAVNGTYQLTGLGGRSGNDLSFGVTTPDTCSIDGDIVAFEHVGTCTVTADQDGNADYDAAPQATQHITVGKGEGIVGFASTAPTNATVGDSSTPSVKPGPGSGTPQIAIAATTSGFGTDGQACTIKGDDVLYRHVGTCDIVVTQAGGDDYVDATSAPQSFEIGKGAQAVSFTLNPQSANVGGTFDITSATKGAGSKGVVYAGNDNCDVDGTKVMFTHVGACDVTADQAGDADYDAAETVTHGVAVGKGSQTITITSEAPQHPVVGGSYTVTATGGASGNQVTFTGNSFCAVSALPASGGAYQASVEFTAIASAPDACVVTAHQDGSDDYDAAPSKQQQVGVAGKATSTTNTVSKGRVVHGEAVRATATVTDGDDGHVVFYVDGKPYDSARVENGTATSRNLAATRVPKGVGREAGLSVGTHGVQAVFFPDDQSSFAQSESGHSTLVVDPAQSATTLRIEKHALVATVAVKKPSADTATGNVTFSVAGKKVGSAPLVDGVARLPHTLAAGKSPAVSATYTGKRDVNEQFAVSPSSDSTARKNPTITATATSAYPKSSFGWFSKPVTVRFACKAGSAAVASCPKPVLVTRDGITTVSRTVLTKDGGTATVTVTVKLDQVRPTLVINKNGTITAKDDRSGIARTLVYKTVRVHSITYYAWATDRAGNTVSAKRKVARD